MKHAIIPMFAGALLLLAASYAGAGTGDLKLPAYKKASLPNGLTLLLMEHHEVPLVSFSMIVKSGSVADPAGKEGLASATAVLLRKGTKTRSAEQISQELDSIGAQFFAGANPDYITIGAEFLRKDLAKGLDLLADSLLNPTFPQAEVDKLMRQGIDGIRVAKDRAQGVLGIYFNAYLFGSHPYGRPAEGDEKSLAAIGRDDVLGYYKANFMPGNVIMAVVGDFSPAEMEKMIAARFGAWPATAAAGAVMPQAEPVRGRKLLLVDKPDATQTFFQIGNVGIARTNPDRVYIDIINTLFGGRFTSMLNNELRVNSGLTYGARSFFTERKAPGPFAISTYTGNATTEKAIDMALDLLRRLHEKGITEEDLNSAKSYVKGQFPPEIETSDRLASLIASLEFFALDENEIDGFYSKVDSMTLVDAKRVIQQYFPLDHLVFVLIGKSSDIAGIAGKYASQIDRKSITDPGF